MGANAFGWAYMGEYYGGDAGSPGPPPVSGTGLLLLLGVG